MKTNRLALLLVVSVCAFSGCKSSSSKKGDKSTSTPSQKPFPPAYEDRWDNYEANYSDYDFKGKVGRQLITEIHNYQIDQHRTYITYGNYWWYANTATDLIPGSNPAQNELFYTGKTSPRETHNDQDREHVWACASSKGLWWRSSQYEETNIGTKGSNGAQYWGGGSDLYNIRPATSRVNSQRSNASFYDFDDDDLINQIALSDGGPYKAYIDSTASAKKVEVDDAFKGDVARILLYVYTHYLKIGEKNVYYSEDYKPVYNIEEAVKLSETHTPDVCGQLTLTDIVAYSNIDEVNEMLVKWNRIDPPSEVEMNRNNYVESVQGNRNPFVDYPQLVDKCLLY